MILETTWIPPPILVLTKQECDYLLPQVWENSTLGPSPRQGNHHRTVTSRKFSLIFSFCRAIFAHNIGNAWFLLLRLSTLFTLTILAAVQFCIWICTLLGHLFTVNITVFYVRWLLWITEYSPSSMDVVATWLVVCALKYQLVVVVCQVASRCRRVWSSCWWFLQNSFQCLFCSQRWLWYKCASPSNSKETSCVYSCFVFVHTCMTTWMELEQKTWF